MRSATGGELTVLAAATRRITHRVKVKNGSGTFIDLSSWVASVSLDRDIDQPVDGLTIAFRRDSGTTLSLSPLRTDSTLNRLDDGTTYSPQLDVNREITYEVATTAIGATVVAGDYKLLFVGSIDNVAFEQSPVVCTCRDQGGLLVDRWVEAVAPYGSGAGVALETVMQDVLDDTLTSGFVTLNVPGLPGFPAFSVSPAYAQQVQSLMEAMSALAQLPGGDARYMHDAGTNTFKFTLHDPPRSKTTPDHTFGPSDYIEVTRLELDRTNIRNVITITYPDTAAGGHLSVTVFDAASITKYGRRFLPIQEPTGSPINTNARATAMANDILWDLKDPKAEFEIDMPFFWPTDLWDLYRFTNNSVHFNTNQDWAVVSITHRLSRNQHRTKLEVRGLPAGAYHAWRGRGDPYNPRPGEVGPEAHIEEMGGGTTPGVENIRYYGTGGTQPYTYRRRIDVETVSIGTWSAPAALPDTEWVVADPTFPTRIFLEVTDATGLIGNADPFFLMVPVTTSQRTGATRAAAALDGSNLLATGIAAAVTIDADQVTDGTTQRAVPFTLLSSAGDANVRKLIGTSSTPSLGSVRSFWDGTNTIVGSDTSGKVSLSTGAGTGTSGVDGNTQFIVTFAVAYAAEPFVLINSRGFGGGVSSVGHWVVSAVTTTNFTVVLEGVTTPAVGAPGYAVTIRYGVIG